LKKNSKIPLLLALALIFGIGLGSLLNFPSGSSRPSDREARLREVLQRIEYQYVDEVNTDSLLSRTINDLLTQLDPHSRYIPQNEVATAEESILGSFEGIGIEFKIYRDTLTIAHVIPGGAAEKAGLRNGDQILTADTVALHGSELSTTQVIQTLKGPAGSQVTIAIRRPFEDTFSVNVQRQAIQVSSIDASFMLDSSTGFIRLSTFSEKSPAEVRQALVKLKQQGAQKLIFDLRNNPGGLLSAARQISDEFLDKGQTIVITKNRQNEQDQIKASAGGVFTTGKMALLINEGSASASEIVAGALQDNGRAIVVGHRSFGKGLVQEEMNLKDGSRLRLTTQRFYTPKGHRIQKPYEEYKNEWERFHALDQNDTLPGKGGIRPDIIVRGGQLDSNLYDGLRQLGFDLDERTFFAAQHLRKYWQNKSAAVFLQKYELDPKTIRRIYPESVMEALSPDTRKALDEHLKALLAFHLYGRAAFYEGVAPQDQYLQKALAALNKP